MKRRTACVLLAALLAPAIAHADDDVVVMTPAPTQAQPPGLRMRTDAWRPDHLWTGVEPPPFVPLAIGDRHLDLLDAAPSGGYVATYRESDVAAEKRGSCANRRATVKGFASDGHALFSVDVDHAFPQRDNSRCRTSATSSVGTARRGRSITTRRATAPRRTPAAAARTSWR